MGKQTAEDALEGPDLTPRQARFVELYVLYGNGKLAAAEAGYSEHTAESQASRLLSYAKVQTAVSALRLKVATSTEVTIERVVLELHRILTVDPIQAFDDFGALKPLDQWPEDLRRALSSIDNEELSAGGPEGETLGQVRKVRFWSKTSAAELLLKKLGGFAPERHEHTVTFAQIVLGMQPKTAAAGVQVEGGPGRGDD